MKKIDEVIQAGVKNFVFLGEAGSGKSEIAINFSKYLYDSTKREVHFFDLDMTKPLFRSREFEKEMCDYGVKLHFEEQFMDAPTEVGGVRPLLKNQEKFVVLDVGGDYIGAKAIGRYRELLNRDDTCVYYVLNSYRPWSTDIDRIDHTFAAIIEVSHMDVEKIKIINNPNLGHETNKEDFFSGCERMKEIITPFKEIEFSCIRNDLYQNLSEGEQQGIFPMEMHVGLNAIT